MVMVVVCFVMMTAAACFLCSCAAQAPLELGYGKDIVFDCENGYSFTVRFKEEKEAELSLPDKTVTLPRVISGSGARYAEGDMVFWTKGEWALLETGSKSYKNCNVRQ